MSFFTEHDNFPFSVLKYDISCPTSIQPFFLKNIVRFCLQSVFMFISIYIDLNRFYCYQNCTCLFIIPNKHCIFYTFIRYISIKKNLYHKISNICILTFFVILHSKRHLIISMKPLSFPKGFLSCTYL